MYEVDTQQYEAEQAYREQQELHEDDMRAEGEIMDQEERDQS